MPKIVEYPRASLANSMELASAVYGLGGHSSIHTCADKMKKKVGGSFSALISATDKFGLIDNEKGELSCTELYNEYKHAYSEEEEQAILRKAFLSSGVFASLYERFRGRIVPAEILDRILIREFEVPPAVASRISGYFINGAKQVGLLDPDNKLVNYDSDITEQSESMKHTEDTLPKEAISSTTQIPDHVETNSAHDSNAYSISFKGPGLNTTFEITEEHDLLIVDAILQKIKKKMESTGE